MSSQLPAAFRARYQTLCSEPEPFFESLTRAHPKSFRVNTLKASPREVAGRFQAYGFQIDPVPWSDGVFILRQGFLAKTLEHALGQIYVQELSSMLSPLAAAEELRSAGLVLDACAAPGSKTTQLAALMENRGSLVANDVDRNRLRALTFNLEKAGVVNTAVICADLRRFTGGPFDVVLLDAPCSAEGTWRSNPALPKLWSERRITHFAKLQRQLILKAFDLLAPGGTLVYSTCTFAPEENEAVVNFLMEERPAKIVPLAFTSFRTAPGLPAWGGRIFKEEIARSTRVFPHHNDTGGFFIAKIVR